MFTVTNTDCLFSLRMESGNNSHPKFLVIYLVAIEHSPDKPVGKTFANSRGKVGARCIMVNPYKLGC